MWRSEVSVFHSPVPFCDCMATFTLCIRRCWLRNGGLLIIYIWHTNMQLSLLISEMEMRSRVCLQCLILQYSAPHIVQLFWTSLYRPVCMCLCFCLCLFSLYEHQISWHGGFSGLLWPSVRPPAYLRHCLTILRVNFLVMFYVKIGLSASCQNYTVL